MNIWHQLIGNTFKAVLVLSVVSYIIDVGPRTVQNHDSWKGTYAIANNQQYAKTSLKHTFSPDTTAVILNWSRFPNVVQIVKTMCSTLQDALATIVIWNNNPQPLTIQDFELSGCPSQMLKIVNSPENAYFQARFIACSQATTPYCFIQDDDFYIAPAVIRAMRGRMAQIASTTSLHLLPSHEMLFSQSSIIKVDSTIHTAFAWLGYGAIIHRSQAKDFLRLLQALDVTDDVWKMADNYFTILANTIPEFWFDQNLELGGGQPFTVGIEGEERNNRHIKNAGLLLDSLTKEAVKSTEISYPYVTIPTPPPISSVSRAACSQEAYVFKSNIQLLSKPFDETALSASAVIEHVKQELGNLSKEEVERYLKFSPSMAVDGNPRTSFQSVNNATQGDWIALDFIYTKAIQPQTEMAFLVDNYTRLLLEDSVFELTDNDVIWDQLQLPVECVETTWMDIQECAVALDEVAGRSYRELRLRLRTSLPHRWRIYEVWMRLKG